MNIEEFYTQDERRRASSEIEFGRDWRDRHDVRYELSWVEDTGELYFMREPSAYMYDDGFGEMYVDELKVDELVIRVLGVVPTHDEVERILTGWSDAMAEPDGIGWLVDRLRQQGVLAPAVSE